MNLIVMLALSMAAGTVVFGCAPWPAAQTFAWDRWRGCDHFATIHLVQISPSGDVVATGREYETAPFQACMQEALVGQRSQGAVVGNPKTTVRDVEGGAGMN